jgi:pimeloyl-ACP methyl ester carboxylesterase
MLAGRIRPMVEQHSVPSVESLPIDGGRLEVWHLPGGPGVPLLVLGGVELGLRSMAGTEHVLFRRWERRAAQRSVTALGRPIPDDPGDAELVMHPRVVADSVASVIRRLATRVEAPLAIEAESGGGRISLWLTIEHPELVSRLVLASVASETPPDTPMARRLARWAELAEAAEWGRLFGGFAQEMKPGSDAREGSFDAAARLQPRPSTPERFIAELRTTLEPSSFVTSRLGEIDVPALVLAGGQDQVVEPERTRQVAAAIPGARFELDPNSGHTVRSSFEGYDKLVEAFLAEGDE